MKQKEEITESEKRKWHLDCFLFRLLCAIGVFVVLLGVLITVIVVIDQFDIAKRCLDYFTPYAASIPWILMIVSVTLLICIPSVTSIIQNLLGNLESMGAFRFYRSIDSNVRQEAEQAVTESGKQLTLEERETLIKQKEKDIEDVKRQIVKIHEEQIQAQLIDHDIGIAGSDLRFEARYKDGKRRIAVKVFPISSKSIESFCIEFDTLRDKFKANNYALHILIYHQDNLRAEEWRKEVSRIIRVSNRVDCVKPYFYSVSKDMTVSPVEDAA